MKTDRSSQSTEKSRHSMGSASLVGPLKSKSSLRTKLSSIASLKGQNVSEGGLLQTKKTATLNFLHKTASNLTANRQKSINPLSEFTGLKHVHTVVRDGVEDAFHAPSFRPMPYGDAWYADVLTVYTNAVRFETKTFFFVLYCLYERSDEIEVGDIKSLYGWFEPYHNFFGAILEVLQGAFLPWVERSADLPSSKPREFFNLEATALRRTVRKTLEHKEDFLAFPPKKAATKLRKTFSKFAVQLLEYLSSLEESTAPIIECHYSIEECRSVSRKMVSDLSKLPHYKKNLALLLRWFGDRHETAAQWRKEHLDAKSNISFGRWKRPGPQEECLSYFKKKCKAISEDRFRGI